MELVRFGQFVAARRQEIGMTMRKLAQELEITPAYLSDIEKSRRYPPDIEMLKKIAKLLGLTQDQTETMFDLAGQDRDEISPDLPEYIMNEPIVTVALRTARDKATDRDWQEFIRRLKKK